MANKAFQEVTWRLEVSGRCYPLESPLARTLRCHGNFLTSGCHWHGTQGGSSPEKTPLRPYFFFPAFWLNLPTTTLKVPELRLQTGRQKHTLPEPHLNSAALLRCRKDTVISLAKYSHPLGAYPGALIWDAPDQVLELKESVRAILDQVQATY
ncbi:hypothetical protein GGX14DRAFT_388993 [Mycena pura]|uniref:Uncharacterized protein n=1 Tax=Mycena pura TaxID=153505 RepID=A0AAD6VUX4_9AGAR|nr:hypothetical protein GGX14DRAFT_388993 [Mycena pura]